MRNTLNEEKLKDRLEGWSAGDAGLAGESQLAEQATIEIDSLCEALTARARCLKHASRSLHGPFPKFHEPRGGVPARQRHRAEERA